MSAISTHVLDTALGKPAAGINIRLDADENGVWQQLTSGTTDSDGRCHDLADNISVGRYRLTFSTGDYFAHQGRTTIYPEIAITFICDGNAHYHLPLLLSDNSYTTYRGS